MQRTSLFACLVLIFLFVSNIAVADQPVRVIGSGGVIFGGPVNLEKASRDTVHLIGAWSTGAVVNGQFQSPVGVPSWNGWTHEDATAASETHWHVSDYSASNLPGGAGNLAACCTDELITSCVAEDPSGGYGNNWREIMEISYAVASPSEPCTMQVDGIFNSNTEAGYDYVTFRFVTGGGKYNVDLFDGIHEAETFSHSYVYQPEDYSGENNDEVCFQIYFNSDAGFSDEDCLYWGNGAIQVDDLRVQCSNGNYDVTTDFEDGSIGDWEFILPGGVGDFSGLWTGLEDLDPCATNYSSQVAFIDDGTQVPGVGPSYCIDWCYGPGGYIVNTTGGAMPGGHLNNMINSPVIDWPGSEFTGGEFAFDVYRHEDLSGNSPGIFYLWNVRSTSDEVTMPIDNQPWESRNFYYYGNPGYVRSDTDISDLLVTGVTQVQVQLVCQEIGFVWGFDGDNGYPAPYFDNVRLDAFEIQGPAMAAQSRNLAQDNFPASGAEVDMLNLASNNVRFDAARNTASYGETHNIPGDSVICSVSSKRVGGEIVSNRLVYTVDRNPVFDSVRDPEWGVSGHTPGYRIGGSDDYFYDLPDSGFLFPGDVLHYYFEATDEVEHTDAQTTTVPMDISGFGDFSHPLAYDTDFQVHALPSVDAEGFHPEILFWNDFGKRGGQDEWYTALSNFGLAAGDKYDIYYTNSPSFGLGNGLGGRAVFDQIKGYTDLLYTAGDLGLYTISNGDISLDPGQDAQLLTQWLNSETPRDVFLCGDNLASDLLQGGPLTNGLLDDFMNVQVVSRSLRQLISNQTTPLVLAEAGNSVFYNSEGWIAYGGCVGINTFDAVISGPGAERLASFTNPAGNADYPYSAATLNITESNDRIISLPYGFMYIYTAPGYPGNFGMSTRSFMLTEILNYFGHSHYCPVGVLPDAGVFTTTNYPNPFNPSTRIDFNLPRPGHLALKIFNVRGELIKTLIDEVRPAGNDFIIWNGTDERGSSVASGVYFYEASSAGERLVEKMVLVK